MYRHARYTWSDQRCPFFGRNGLFFLRMFKAKPHATDEAAGPGWLERLPREAAMLGCLGLSLFLLVTLASFSPDDPGWSSSGSGAPVQNLAGPIGAWIAAVLLSLCGYVAFLLDRKSVVSGKSRVVLVDHG